MSSVRPAMDELRERLELNGVRADVAVRVATALLGLARQNAWAEHPERMADWIERLALDVVKQPS